ncbi:MAG: hypothetical protein AB7F89_09080 [Pirellulaceae bacterium]
MQLDRTLISIRERSLLETLDLSLHTVRRYFSPLAITFCLAALPLFVVNHFLLGWILDVEYRDTYFYSEEGGAIARYVWDMSLLVILEAPLASIFATKFLGDAVFVERPRIRRVAEDVARRAGPLAWCQLLVRGILPAWLFLAIVPRDSEFSVGIEFLLLGSLAGYSCLLRGFRPYVNEIILLEQNPLVARSNRALTIGKRSHYLHTPSSGDLFARWCGTAAIAVMLTGTVFGAFLFVSGVFFNRWQPGPIMLVVSYPLSLWIVAGFMTVTRFLNYLDLRIRHEGWEVELLLRAEAHRMASRPA